MLASTSAPAQLVGDNEAESEFCKPLWMDGNGAMLTNERHPTLQA